MQKTSGTTDNHVNTLFMADYNFFSLAILGDTQYIK